MKKELVLLAFECLNLAWILLKNDSHLILSFQQQQHPSSA